MALAETEEILIRRPRSIKLKSQKKLNLLKNKLVMLKLNRQIKDDAAKRTSKQMARMSFSLQKKRVGCKQLRRRKMLNLTLKRDQIKGEEAVASSVGEIKEEVVEATSLCR